LSLCPTCSLMQSLYLRCFSEVACSLLTPTASLFVCKDSSWFFGKSLAAFFFRQITPQLRLSTFLPRAIRHSVLRLLLPLPSFRFGPPPTNPLFVCIPPPPKVFCPHASPSYPPPPPPPGSPINSVGPRRWSPC